MYAYKAYGFNIHSELVLPELVPGSLSETPDVIVRSGDLDDPPADRPDENLYSRIEGDDVYLFYKYGGAYLIRSGSEIIADPLPDIEEYVARIFILGGALGMIAHQRGYFTLHASAVHMNDHAVAFIGWKGYGKSTTAAAFHAHGYPIITDDMIPIDLAGTGQPVVYPGFPQLKLWPDAAEASFADDPAQLDKLHPLLEKRARRVDDGFEVDALPLNGIYVLDFGDEPGIEPITSREALIELVRHSYAVRFLGNEGVSADYFQQGLQVLDRVPVRRLVRERSLDELPRVIQMVEDDQLDAVGDAFGVSGAHLTERSASGAP